jgi:hypothetical protein
MNPDHHARFAPMDQIVKYSIIIAILVAMPSVLYADTYKWVNEEGVTTYSQTPPKGVKAERVKVYGSKSPSGAQDSQNRVKQLRQKMADSAEDRELEKQQRQSDKTERERKQKNCQAARENLHALEILGSRRYKVDGEYRRLSEEERQQLMQKEKEHIKANCEK